MYVQVLPPGCKIQLLLWNRRYGPGWTCCLLWASPCHFPAQNSSKAGEQEHVPAALTLLCPAETVTDPVAVGCVFCSSPFPFMLILHFLVSQV